MPIDERVSGNQGSLFGGAGLAAGVAALETVTGLRPVWATGQFLARTDPDSTLRLRVDLPAQGRSVTQAHITGLVDDQSVVTVIGAAGTGRSLASGLWPKFPTVKDPQDCEYVDRNFDVPTVHDHVEVRVARGMFGFNGIGTPSGDNHTLLWVRMPQVELGAASIALMGDYMVSALGNALGKITFCTSLDNTIRFAGPPPASDRYDGWLLCDNRIEYVGEGFANGSAFIWAPDGSLLATASQSMVVRDG